MIQTYTQAISAGGSFPVAVAGKYFRVIDASASVDLTFWAKGRQLGQAIGVGVGFWVKPIASYDRVDVYSATAQTVTVMSGSGEAGYDRVTVSGQVQVIDGEKNRVLANQVFGAWLVGAAVAAQFPCCAILAPAGRNLSIKRIYPVAYAASNIGWGWVTPANMAGTYTSAGGYAASRLGGGAASLARVYSPPGNAAATPNINMVDYTQLVANAGGVIELQRPIVIPPGYGFAFYGATVNQQLNVSVDFTEDPV
jgi:hypothetical protein